MNENRVRLQDIYNKVVQYYKDGNTVDDESLIRLLRKKYAFLQKNWYYAIRGILKKKVSIMFQLTMKPSFAIYLLRLLEATGKA